MINNINYEDIFGKYFRVKYFPENIYFSEMLFFGKENIFKKGKYFQVFCCIMKIVVENIFMCLVLF